ncbi:MAG: DUF115 domain-containing protein [Thaumarchaeota archaeon]|nr:DUF115 domain-containing protein [Nitrososphaerota archaeon]
MRLPGWARRYSEILHEFGFDRKEDLRAARFLDSLLERKEPLGTLERMIRGHTVFVIGAGPSLSSAIPHIKKFGQVTKIAADGATEALIENGIRPDIVVTDLDGSLEHLKKASEENSIMVVHSHGDNIGTLPLALLFRHCIGTTEGRPFGRIRNFGGFTDGDRCVFLARYFGVEKIVLFGMDFGKKIGTYSKDVKYDRKVKLAKLARARELLEWLASRKECKYYTTTEKIRGFEKIRFSDLEELTKKH